MKNIFYYILLFLIGCFVGWYSCLYQVELGAWLIARQLDFETLYKYILGVQ